MLNISNLLKNIELNNYLRQVSLINNLDYPYLSYVGINFNKNKILNIKFYFSFFKPLTDSEIKYLLPIKYFNEFKSHYNFWLPTKNYNSLHRGVTFALKIKDDKITNYYHLRVPNITHACPEKISNLQNDNYIGISKEINQNDSIVKKYFYYDNQDEMKILINNFNQNWVSKYLNKIEQIEYIESNIKDKIDLISSDQNLIKDFLKKNASINMQEEIENIVLKTGLKLFAPGVNKANDTFSIYFIDDIAINKYIEFDGVSTFINSYFK